MALTQIKSSVVADDAIVTAAIADDAVTAAKIADDAVVTAAIADDAVVTAAIADDAVVQAAIADDAVDEARLQISNAGSNGEYLQKQSGDTGGLTWAAVSIPASAYSTWLVKTTTFTAASGDQLIANHATTAFTITLPASPSVGDTVVLKNVGAALLTVGRNSQNINSAAADATMPTGNAAQLVFVDATIGWTVL